MKQISHVNCLALALIAFASCSSVPMDSRSQAQSGKPLVLITAFDPFNDASVNESYNVAREIALQASGFDVETCLIPTRYAEAVPAAMRCYEKLVETEARKPVWILSLGEGHCSIDLETRARNLDDAEFADNSGEIRRRKPIDFTDRTNIALMLPAEEMREILSKEEKARVRVSDDAGTFVCNHVAYEMGLSAQAGRIPSFGFIHVPNHRCDEEQKNVVRNATLINRMVEKLLTTPAPFSIQ